MKLKKPKRRNPAAEAVRTPRFRPKVKPSAKEYRRKPKHPKGENDDGSTIS